MLDIKVLDQFRKSKGLDLSDAAKCTVSRILRGELRPLSMTVEPVWLELGNDIRGGRGMRWRRWRDSLHRKNLLPAG